MLRDPLQHPNTSGRKTFGIDGYSLFRPFTGLSVSILVFCSLLTSSISMAQTWNSLGSGTNNTVYSLATDSANNVLYVGGKFTTAGGSANNYLAKWDGNNWQSISSSFNARIYSLRFLDGELYATGDFTTIDGNTFNHIAKWDGSNWISFGLGVDGTVYATEIYNDTLYIGGSFLNSGGNPVSKIAKWDGTNWVQVSGGTNLKVRALKSFGGELYVGGAFTIAGGTSIDRIAKWDGANWSALDGGMDYDVYDLEVFNNQIHASGWFSPSPAKYIARWDGSAWQSLGSGTNARVPDMVVYNGELYATGAFTSAGGNSVNRIAKWNGSSWTAVGNPGLEGSVTAEGYALAVMGGALFAAGSFDSAGGVSASNIAQWGTFCPYPTASFISVVDTGGQVVFNNTSIGGSVWNWDFGDGNNSTDSSPTYTYLNSGTYQVCLTVSDTCGSKMYCDSVTVELCQLPTTNFGFLDSGLTLTFTNTSSSGTYTWDFGDGTFSTLMDPIHTYATAGSYIVCLTVVDSCGSNMFCNLINVTCPIPSASFSYIDSNLTVTFSNTSTGGTSFWDFGDGATDTIANPTHSYAVSNTYYVCLTVSNSCGSSTICDSVAILIAGVNEQLANSGILSAFPIPAKDRITIQVTENSLSRIQLYNSLSQKVIDHLTIGAEAKIDLGHLGNGMYVLRVELNSGQIITQRIIVQD